VPLQTACGTHRSKLNVSCPECLAAAAATRTLKRRRLDALTKENRVRREHKKRLAEAKRSRDLDASLVKPKPFRWTQHESGGWLCGKHNELTVIRRDGTHCCRSCKAAWAVRWQLERGAERARQRKHDQNLLKGSLPFADPTSCGKPPLQPRPKTGRSCKSGLVLARAQVAL
jgi:hypothetical protein